MPSSAATARRMDSPPPSRSAPQGPAATENELARSSSAPGLRRSSDEYAWEASPAPWKWSENAPNPCYKSYRGVSSSHGIAAKYELGRRLAAGHKGVVYLGTERGSGRTVVVKQPTDVSDTSDYDHLVGKRHPNILRVFACFNEAAQTSVVMDYCAGGDLFQVLQTFGGTLAEGWNAAVFEQVLSGVEYLHECFGESHNDIKPENILLDRELTGRQDVPKVLLADFGCVAAAGSTTVAAGGGGDPRYRAPETFHGAAFGVPTDVWSLGVVLFELLTGGLLIHTREFNIRGWNHFARHEGGKACSRLMARLKSGEAVEVDTIKGTRARDLLGRLLELDPKRRPTVRVARVHPWFAVRLLGPASASGLGAPTPPEEAQAPGHSRSKNVVADTSPHWPDGFNIPVTSGWGAEGQEMPQPRRSWGGC